MKESKKRSLAAIANQDLLSEMEMLEVFGGVTESGGNMLCVKNGACDNNTRSCKKNRTCYNNYICEDNKSCNSGCTSGGGGNSTCEIKENDPNAPNDGCV